MILMGYPMHALRNESGKWLLLMMCFSLSSVVVLVLLGIWQLERLEWKMSLIALVEERQKIDVVPFSTFYSTENFSDHNYQRVSVEGRFLNEHSFLLSPRIYNKQSGSHLVTPLRLPDGNVVAVNRGWVPQKYILGSGSREGLVSINATIREPMKQKLFTPNNDLIKNHWYWIDLDAISRTVRVAVLPLVLEQNPPGDESTFPIANQTVISWSNNHLQYALTWFGLALVFLVGSATYFLKHRV